MLNSLVTVLLATLIVSAAAIVFMGLLAFTSIIVDAIRPPKRSKRRRRAHQSPETIRGPWNK